MPMTPQEAIEYLVQRAEGKGLTYLPAIKEMPHWDSWDEEPEEPTAITFETARQLAEKYTHTSLVEPEDSDQGLSISFNIRPGELVLTLADAQLDWAEKLQTPDRYGVF